MIDDLNTGIEVPNEPVPTGLPDTEAPASAPETGDVESRARAQGWVDRDEWTGDPERWRPADEFVKRGEELLPVAIERNRALERKQQELEQRLAERERTFQEQIARIERVSMTALQRQRDQLDAQYQAAMRQAVELGDTARFDQLARDQREALGQFDEQIAVHQRPAPARDGLVPLPADQDAIRSQWMARNTWFHADPVLNSVAQAIHVHLGRERPGLSLADNLAATEAEVRRRFPEKFQAPGVGTGRLSPAAMIPAVESGAGRLPARSGPRAKGVADLPSEARRAGENFVKMGLYKNIKEYATEYFEDET
jgi:hypothetical protein